MADVIGDGADALKEKAKLNVSDLNEDLHPTRRSVKKKASWVCDQVHQLT